MYDKVYDAIVYEQANIKNKMLLSDYLVELKSRKRRPGTLEQYLANGKMLICYIKLYMNDRYILDFTKKDFRQIGLWFTEDRGVSNARYNCIFSLIHGMAEYAEDEEDYEYVKNYARKVKNLPKSPVREISFLTDEQILKLRMNLLEKKMYRECAYLDVSYDSTARLNEVAQIRREGLIENRCSNIVTGKRGKRFSVVINSRSVESLNLYFKERNDDLDIVFMSSRKPYRSVSPKTLYDWTKEMCVVLSKLEGKEIDFSPHSFRHSALENYENGTHYMCRELAQPKRFALNELQAIARHESMDTTKSYLKPKENNVIENMFNIKLS